MVRDPGNQECTWLILPGILYVTNARITKALTYSSCPVDVILSPTSTYCMTANPSSPTAIPPLPKGFTNLASVWEFGQLWCHNILRHQGVVAKTHRPDWWNVPSLSGGHNTNCSPVGTIVNSETVLDGSVIHHYLLSPTRGSKAGLRGTLSRNCNLSAVSQLMALPSAK